MQAKSLGAFSATFIQLDGVENIELYLCSSLSPQQDDLFCAVKCYRTFFTWAGLEKT